MQKDFKVHRLNIKSGLESVSSETWEKTKNFCPACGKAQLWMRTDVAGDYYLGEQHLCTECWCSLFLPAIYPGDCVDDQQRLAHLRDNSLKGNDSE